MFILFLDDNQDRHDAAEKAFSQSDHILLHAYNQSDVLEIVKGCQEKIGLAMLDHDLDEGEPNGSQVASAWLSLDAKKFPARVIVHSNNSEGAKNIVSKFTSAGVFAEWKPFGIGAGYWGHLLKSLVKE